jgi:5-methylcytosine-specific restriction protein A
MGKITNLMVEKSFEIGKRFYQNKISLKEGIKVLTDIGMNENSAVDYVYNYSNLIQGKLFTRTTNIYGTEYFLQKILEENGSEGLQNALLSLSQHIDYYEEKSGASVKKKKEVYEKYLNLVDTKPERPIYPDEVDSDIEYSEGKTKQVLINSYERNPIARQKCIDHYGLNCQVCNFNFQEKFGDLGKEFIHVHHKVDISTIGNEYSVNPVTDLIPVCPNCHAMLHKRKPAYSIEELKRMIK